MTAFFIYSTGRCATQWLTRFFAQNLGERAVVEHEPAGVDWSARRALRHPNLGELRRRMPDVDRHLDTIAETVASGRIYVQTGWPAFGWFPYLASFFGEQFRWVHLVRHPLYVAGSMTTHRYYAAARRDALAAHAFIEPSDRGAAYRSLAGQWSRLSSFEKCLYLWAEINRYGLDLAAAEPTRPVSVIRYEDIFAGDPEPLKQLGRAAGVDGPVMIESAPFDRFQRPSRQRPVVASADLWERVTGLAERLGYPAEKLDRADIGDAVWRRYSWGGRGAKGFRKIRRIVEFSVLNLLGR